MVYVFLVFLGIVIAAYGIGAYDIREAVFDKRNNAVVINAEVTRFTVSGITQCSSLCLAKSECTSFSMHTLHNRAHNCELNYGGILITKANNNEWLVYERVSTTINSKESFINKNVFAPTELLIVPIHLKQFRHNQCYNMYHYPKVHTGKIF